VTHTPPEQASPRREPNRRPARSWWGGNADRGDSVRLEAFSGGVLAIAITLLILDVRVEQQPGESLAAAFAHAGPEIGAYAASFLQTRVLWDAAGAEKTSSVHLDAPVVGVDVVGGHWPYRTTCTPSGGGPVGRPRAPPAAPACSTATSTAPGKASERWPSWAT